MVAKQPSIAVSSSSDNETNEDSKQTKRQKLNHNSEENESGDYKRAVGGRKRRIQFTDMTERIATKSENAGSMNPLRSGNPISNIKFNHPDLKTEDSKPLIKNEADPMPSSPNASFLIPVLRNLSQAKEHWQPTHKFNTNNNHNNDGTSDTTVNVNSTKKDFQRLISASLSATSFASSSSFS